MFVDDFQVKFGTGSLMTYISWSSDFLKFFHLSHLSFSVTPGPTELYLAFVKCLCLGQLLSNCCS